MSDANKIKNHLFRDGTNQEMRNLEALSKDYVNIDERDLIDILHFTGKYAGLVSFINNENNFSGNWASLFRELAEIKNRKEFKSFLKRNERKVKPHLALFLSFLRIFKYAQNQINNITWEHLNFYYKEVLKIKEKSEVPDKAHVLFTPAKQVKKPYQVDKGTKLSAGKDKTGVPVIFKTTENTSISKVTLKKIQSSFKDKTNGCLYVATQANSADGQGADFETPEPKWSAFGQSQIGIKPTMSLPETGIAIASPVLDLKEGDRTVIFTFILKKEKKLAHGVDKNIIKNNAQNLKKIENAFKIYFTGEKDWTEPILTNAEYSTDKLVITVKLDPDFDAVYNYDEETHASGYKVEVPVAKIILNNVAGKKYNFYEHLEFESIEITVDVKDIQNIVIQNSNSVLDPNKPFQPFGAEPVLGQDFYVGSNEVFKKPLTYLKYKIKWQGTPQKLNEIYGTYDDGTISNSAFKFDMHLLEKKDWKKVIDASVKTAPSLFDNNDARLLKEISVELDKQDGNERKIDRVISYYGQDKFNKYEKSLKYGFSKIQLRGVDKTIQAFGHKDYRKIYIDKIVKKIKNEEETLPIEPYTPVIESLSIDYKATEKILAGSSKNELGQNAFYHIGGLGTEKIDLSQIQKVSFLPKHPHEGALYLGFSDLIPSQNLSLFFQVAEGSGDATIIPRPSISWSCLSDNKWIKFSTKQLLKDSSSEFMTSGIISFQIPAKANNNSTVLENGLYWIRGIVASDTAAINQLIDIKPNAALAEFVNQNNDPDRLKEALKKESLTKLLVKDSNIKNVEQPFASFGGKAAELSENFYTRVSERLRHKNRAITIWDYEHLVLEKFPSVYKVKCQGHTDINGNYKPGFVTLVIVSNLYNKNATDPIRPSASEIELKNIEDYLLGKNGNKRIVPPFVNLEVKNPEFEEVEVAFSIKFKHGIDVEIHHDKIDRDIQEYLSPWAFRVGADIQFDGKIYKSRVINFIEELDYVDYVTNFKMHQQTKNEGKKENIDVAMASVSGAILVSASSHYDTIEIIKSDNNS